MDAEERIAKGIAAARLRNPPTFQDTLNHYNRARVIIDRKIRQCLTEGWRIQLTETHALIPPEEDERVDWAASWTPVPFDGRVIIVPSYL